MSRTGEVAGDLADSGRVAGWTRSAWASNAASVKDSLPTSWTREIPDPLRQPSQSGPELP